jgi:hypothetical protein
MIGLAIQVVVWPILYFLSEVHFRWLIRRRRAKGNMSNRGHYGEVIVVLAILFVLAWILMSSCELFRTPGNE